MGKGEYTWGFEVNVYEEEGERLWGGGEYIWGRRVTDMGQRVNAYGDGVKEGDIGRGWGPSSAHMRNVNGCYYL